MADIVITPQKAPQTVRQRGEGRSHVKWSCPEKLNNCPTAIILQAKKTHNEGHAYLPRVCKISQTEHLCVCVRMCGLV